MTRQMGPHLITPTARALGQHSTAWREGRRPVAAMCLGGKPVDNGTATRALREARLLDTRAVELPGAMVMLPRAVDLLHRYAGWVREAFGALGYLEHDFPSLIPSAMMEPIDRLYPLDGKLLRVGDDDDWGAQRPRAVLAPSGEAVLSSFWASSGLRSADLPSRVMRQTRYYRPMPRGRRSGRGLFRSMEAGDVFETQACVMPERSSDEIAAIADAIRGLVRRMSIPTLVTERPLAGNNSAMSMQTIGFDAVSPFGGVVQIGSAYDQADLVSRAYGVRVQTGSGVIVPHQVTSAVTRRMLLAHVVQFIRTDGSALIHPFLAAEQVRLCVIGDGDAARRYVTDLREGMRSVGLRAAVDIGERATVALATARRDAVPLRGVLFIGSDGAEDRLLLERGDTGEERDIAGVVLSQAIAVIRDSVTEVSSALDHEVRLFAEQRVAAFDGPDAMPEVIEWTAARNIAVLPLSTDSGAAAHLEGVITGEILGTYLCRDSGRCIVTGELVHSRAVVGPRA